MSAAPLISVNSQAQTRQAAVSAKALAEPRPCLPTPIVAQPGPPGLPGAHSQARPERWTASLLGALGTPRRAARPGGCTVVCCCCCCWHEQAAWTGAQMMGHESKVSARSARFANRIGPRYLWHLSQGLAAGWLPLQRPLRVVRPSLCNLLPGLQVAQNSANAAGTKSPCSATPLPAIDDLLSCGCPHKAPRTYPAAHHCWLHNPSARAEASRGCTLRFKGKACASNISQDCRFIACLASSALRMQHTWAQATRANVEVLEVKGSSRQFGVHAHALHPRPTCVDRRGARVQSLDVRLVQVLAAALRLPLDTFVE